MVFSLGKAVLPNLIQQSFVTDLKQDRGLFTVPIGFVKSFGDSFGFGFILSAAGQRLQSTGRSIPILSRRIELRSAAIALRFEFVDGQLFITQHQIALDEIA